MYPRSCNPLCCGRRPRRAPARLRGWLAVAVVTVLLALRGAGVEAQAAVHQRHSAGRGADGDPLLGSLSFSSSDEPVEVTSKSLEFDYRSRVLTYRGDVVATQGDVKLAADTLTLALAQDSTNSLRTVVAEGNVRFSKGDRRASARRAEYDQAKRLIILDQDAVLEDSRGNVTGDRVSVYLDEGRTVVEGGEGRVRAVLRPAEEVDAGGDKAAHVGSADEGVVP